MASRLAASEMTSLTDLHLVLEINTWSVIGGLQIGDCSHMFQTHGMHMYQQNSEYAV